MAEIIRCPECGHVVQSYFDHVDIDCEHDMTEEEITALMRGDAPSKDPGRETKLRRGLRAWNADAIRTNG